MVRESFSKVLNLRISETELAMLEKISEDTGLTMAAVLRQFIRSDFALRYPNKAALESVEKRIAAFNARTTAKSKKRRPKR